MKFSKNPYKNKFFRRFSCLYAHGRAGGRGGGGRSLLIGNPHWYEVMQNSSESGT